VLLPVRWASKLSSPKEKTPYMKRVFGQLPSHSPAVVTFALMRRSSCTIGKDNNFLPRKACAAPGRMSLMEVVLPKSRRSHKSGFFFGTQMAATPTAAPSTTCATIALSGTTTTLIHCRHGQNDHAKLLAILLPWLARPLDTALFLAHTKKSAGDIALINHVRHEKVDLR